MLVFWRGVIRAIIPVDISDFTIPNWTKDIEIYRRNLRLKIASENDSQIWQCYDECELQ